MRKKQHRVLIQRKPDDVFEDDAHKKAFLKSIRLWIKRAEEQMRSRNMGLDMTAATFRQPDRRN